MREHIIPVLCITTLLYIFATAMGHITKEAAITAYLTHDRVKASHRMCWYNYSGSETTVMIEAHIMCPTTLTFERSKP